MKIEKTFVFIGGMFAFVYSGCQVPPYQLPGGYSSTYRRRLQAVEVPLLIPAPILPEAAGPEMQPPKEAAPEVGVFYPPTFQYNPPTKSEFQQAVILPDDRPASADAAAGLRRY